MKAHGENRMTIKPPSNERFSYTHLCGQLHKNMLKSICNKVETWLQVLFLYLERMWNNENWSKSWRSAYQWLRQRHRQTEPPCDNSEGKGPWNYRGESIQWGYQEKWRHNRYSWPRSGTCLCKYPWWFTCSSWRRYRTSCRCAYHRWNSHRNGTQGQAERLVLRYVQC